MIRFYSYLLSLLFLLGFFVFDYYWSLYDPAIPYFGAVLFSLWSPRRQDVIVVSALCLLTTLAGGYVSVGSGQSFSEALQTIFVERSLSIFALVCVAYVGWRRRGISIRLEKMNELLEQRVDLSEKESIEIQEQLNEISSALKLHTVERRKSEREFKETIASYQNLLESLPINVFQKNRKNQLTVGNARYFETLGMKREECIGKTDFDLFPRELAEKYHADDQKVLKTGEPLELIEEHVRADGTKIYVQVFKAPIRNAQGEIIGLQGMFWDVSDRIRAEQSQKEADARFRSLVNSNIIGITTATLDGELLEANDEFLNMLGYTREEFEAQGGLRWDQLTPDEFRPIDDQMEQELIQHGYCKPLEKEYFHKSGRRIPVLVGAVKIDSQKREAICSVVDITPQKEAEKALKMAKDAADEANRSKSLFLANMSHEIRTPLNAIIGLTDLVLRGKLAREQREYLKMVNESGEALLEIISDILDFSKLQAGKVKLEPVEFSLREKIGEIVRPLALKASEKSLQLVTDIASDVPDRLKGDAVCLRQVITNLVNNAIKFTDNGEVVLTVTVSNRQDASVQLHVSVSDTGAGIEKELQERIFREFEQADNTSTRQFGGTGLGLAICSNLVQLMNGEIWVDSEPGQGSTFHFTCQWTVLGPGESRKLPEEIGSGRVFLFDQHPMSLAAIEKILQRWDLNVDAYSDPQSAMRAAQKMGDGAYQILVIDEESFEQLGRPLVEQIRNKCPALQTITLTTSLDESVMDPGTSSALEADRRLLKPVQESELFDAIADSFGVSESVPIVVQDSEPKVAPMKILLAEDNLVNQRLAIAILGERNHDVQIASNGTEAVSLATSQAFDLILMDIQMPVMDGLEATRQIRQREKASGRHTLIIALTAHAGESDRVRCINAGMDGYVTKPIRPTELMHEINRLRQEWIPGDPNVEQETSQNNSSRPAGDAVIDWEEALAQTGNDANLLKELIKIFEAESRDVFAEIAAAVKSGDRKTAKAKTHQLKGSFRVFACRSALDAANALESSADDQPLQPLFENVKTEYERVYQALTDYRNDALKR